MFDFTRAPIRGALVRTTNFRFSSIDLKFNRRSRSYLAARRKPWRNMQPGIHLCSWRRKSWEERYSWKIWGWSWWAQWSPRGPPGQEWPLCSARSWPTRWPRSRRRECRFGWGSIPSTSQIVSHRQDGNSFLKTVDGVYSLSPMVYDTSLECKSRALKMLHTLTSNKVNGINERVW